MNYAKRDRTRKFYEYFLLAKAYSKNAYGQKKFKGYLPSFKEWYADVAFEPLYLEDGQTGIIDRFVTENEMKEILFALNCSVVGGPSFHIEEFANYIKAEISGSGRLRGSFQIFSDFSDEGESDRRLLFDGNFLHGVAYGTFDEWDGLNFPQHSIEIRFGKRHGREIDYDASNYGPYVKEVITWKDGWQTGLKEQFHWGSHFVRTRSNYQWDERVGPQRYFSVEDRVKSVLLPENDVKHPKTILGKRQSFLS